MQQIQAELNEVKDTVFLGNDCEEIVQQIFKSRFRSKELEENLKFMNNISYKALLNKDEDDSQLQLDLDFYVGSKWLKQSADERRKLFLEEKELLRGEKDDDVHVQQGSIEVTTQRDNDSILNNQRSVSLLFKSHLNHPPAHRKSNSFDFKKFIRSKLRRIQQHDPERYDDIQHRSIEIQNDNDEEFGYIKLHKPHLLHWNHKSPFNLTTIRMANKLHLPKHIANH